MKKINSILVLLSIAAFSASAQTVGSYVTTADGNMLLKRSETSEFQNTMVGRNAPIVVDTCQRFQRMEGFGYALTGGSAELLMKMSAGARKEILYELFSPEALGISFIRLTVGASDMNSEVFSYDDMPEGKTDFKLKSFSLANDLNDVVPVMREILEINPDVVIMASPWSAPAWMKESFDVRGYKLRKDCYDVYSRYFVKYVQEMAKHGIHIDALTIQNEPLNSRNTPSMPWSPQDQAEFIGGYLGPQFAANGIDTKIILFDHNCDRPDYPLSLLSDSSVDKYVCGTAFHHYMGDLSAMSQIHMARPDKDIYFTEQMIVDRSGVVSRTIAPNVKRMLIDVTRNWSRNVVLWNLAADPHAGPHTDNGGCPFCHGAITIDGDEVTRNIAYYTLAHASSFVPTGSWRIASTAPEDPAVMLADDEQNPGVYRVNRYDRSSVLPNVAYLTPEGKVVLVVSNTTSSDVTFNIQFNGKYAAFVLESGAAGTYIW